MPQQMRFAIVEDSDRDLANLKLCIERFAKERGISILTNVYRDGLSFVQAYQPVFDMVLMDVEMPKLDGLTTAARMREKDERVPLIFITQMAQYAIRGYEVSALDYIVKPVSYGTLATKLDHAFRLSQRQGFRADEFIVLSTGTDSFRRIFTRDILYIVKDRNYIRYVTRDEELRVRGTLREAEERFEGTTLIKCANGCMVNLHNLDKKVKNTVCIGGVEFTVTKPYQEEFTEKFMQYLRGGS